MSSRLSLHKPRRPRPDPLPSLRTITATMAEGERRMNADPKPCLLCTGPPSEVGFWMGTDEAARRFGKPPGEPIAISFTLCEACAARGDIREAVQTAMAMAANSLPLMN